MSDGLKHITKRTLNLPKQVAQEVGRALDARADDEKHRVPVSDRQLTFHTPPMTADRLVATYDAEISGNTHFHGSWHLSGGALNQYGQFSADKK